MTDRPKKALVLSGGGVAGGAWMLGLIDALRIGGVDLSQADLIVGTSAGARVGAQLATGMLAQAVNRQRRSDVASVDAPVELEDFVAAARAILAAGLDRQEAVRQIANLEPLGSRLVPAATRMREIANELPAQSWPDRRLVVATVDAESGARVPFDADSGVGLVDAATASSALPGIVELMTIDGRRYADGGTHSPYNVDLAVGYDTVIVLTPLASNPYRQRVLDSEVRALGEATVRVMAADEASLAAIGPNPLSSVTARAAFDAGYAQAVRELNAVEALWGSEAGQPV